MENELLNLTKNDLNDYKETQLDEIKYANREIRNDLKSLRDRIDLAVDRITDDYTMDELDFIISSAMRIREQEVRRSTSAQKYRMLVMLEQRSEKNGGQ